MIERDEQRVVVVERESLRTTLLVGFSMLTLVGLTSIVLIALLRRKEKPSSLGTAVPSLPPLSPWATAFAPPPLPSVLTPLPTSSTVHVPVAEAPLVEAAPVQQQSVAPTVEGARTYARKSRAFTPSTLRTMRLPWLADVSTPAIRVATAGDRPYEVIVRVVAPPGALAAVSFAPNELNVAQPVVAPGLSSVPAGDTLVVPAGQHQLVRMNPKQALYAKGNFGGPHPLGFVVISVTAADYTDPAEG